MIANNDRFEEFVHPLIHAGMEKNDAFECRYGHHDRFEWDDNCSTLIFLDDNLPTVRILCSVVGTTEGDSWQWSWANENIPRNEKVDMLRVREFGEANGYEQLTAPFLVADEYTGWEMTAVAEHILDALGAYRLPSDKGFCYLAYRKIEVVKS